MKIIRFLAENIKRIKVVEITPDGNIVQVSGPNDSGKTSVLDAIWWALDGGRNIQKKPLRTGATKGLIELDLGEMVVSRSFTESGSYLTVTNADGAVFSSPQKVLDKLIGKLSFDPLGFLRQKPSEQVATLEGIAGVDGSEVRKLNVADYDLRRDLNRDAKAARVKADGIEIVEGYANPTPINISKLRDRIAAATKDQAEHQARVDEIATLEARITAGKKMIKSLEGQLSALQDVPAMEDVDMEALNAEFDAAEYQNERTRNAAQKAAHIAEAESLEHQAEKLTEAMENRSAAFRAEVAAAELPLEGLGLDLEENIVTFNDLPLDQASTAAQTRISTAIAMKANPTIRVIRIQDGSLLDAKSLALISKMADDEDYQIWIETVDTSGKVGVVLEDGLVVS